MVRHEDEEQDDRVKVATEHRKAAQQRLGLRGQSNTIDAADASVGWTAQSGTDGAWSETSDDPWRNDPNQNAPGQVFHSSQLPNPEVALAAGMPPQQIPNDLVIEDVEDAFAHPQGPDVVELAYASQRDAVKQSLRENVNRRNAESAAVNSAVKDAVLDEVDDEDEPDGEDAPDGADGPVEEAEQSDEETKDQPDGDAEQVKEQAPPEVKQSREQNREQAEKNDSAPKGRGRRTGAKSD